MRCEDIEQDLALYLYDELPAGEREAWEAHFASCPHCRAALEEAQRLRELLSQRPSLEATPELLAECRLALDEGLDRETARLGWRELISEGLSFLRPGPAFRAAGALGVLVFGFSLGWALRPHAAALPSGSSGIARSSIAGPPELDQMRISGISGVVPDPKTGEVHITLDAARRVTLEGSLDDPRIQQLLVSAVKSYDNPGIRRDTLDALRARASNPNVRQALLYATAHDPNLGVRLEALDAVRGLEWGADSRLTFLYVLEHDTNPGLRAAAVEELVQHADQETLPVLRRLAANDTCRYVRLKCARAVQEAEGK